MRWYHLRVMFFRQVFDPSLAQYAYLVGCQKTREAVVIDPERDVDRYLEIAAAEGLRLTAATETHIHADFLSGARELAERGLTVYLSDEGGDGWRYGWAKNEGYDVRLLRDGDAFSVGNVELRAMHTPGHTPEHLSFKIIDHGGGAREPLGIASGDFVFVGDLGRPDLLESAVGVAGTREPSARRLYDSLPRFLELPDYLQVWPGHGAGSACGKALGAVPMSTVGYERRHNAALLAADGGEASFVESILEGQPEPPLYFARMKRLNRDGPPILGELPRPARITATELASLAGRHDLAVLDTRLDRTAFMNGHLPGSIYAPLNKSFPTIAGSYVEAGTPIYLLIEVEQVVAAVRQLARIGLDDVVGHATPATLAEANVELAVTETVDFARGRQLEADRDAVTLDVRRLAEFENGRVPGALNVAHTRLLARHGEIPRGKPLLVHCQTGARASSAASLLERLGYEVLYVDDDFGKHYP